MTELSTVTREWLDRCLVGTRVRHADEVWEKTGRNTWRWTSHQEDWIIATSALASKGALPRVQLPLPEETT